MLFGLQRRLARGDRFGLRNRRRRLRRAAIEIGDRDFSLRWLRRCKLVADRTRKPVLAIAAATTAASAAAAAAARTALATLIVATGKVRLLLGLVLLGFAVAGLACFFGEAFGFLGLNLGLELRINAVILVGGFVAVHRMGRRLRSDQCFRRFQRVHLLAAVDDVGLLSADTWIGDDRQSDLEGVFEI